MNVFASVHQKHISCPWFASYLIIPILVSVTFLAGCSTGIRVTRINDDAPQVGNPWNLAMTTFKVTVIRQVTKCGPELVGQVDVLATPELALDKEQRYVLVSNGWWATSDISSALASSGISTGLNAASADKSAAIIGNTVGTIAKIAIGTTVAGSSGTPGVEPVVERCDPKVAAAVKALYPVPGEVSLKRKVEMQTEASTKATAALALVVQQSKYDKSLRKKIPAALQAETDATTELAKLERELEEKLAITTHVQTVRWPTTASEFETIAPLTIDESQYEKWASPQQNRTQFLRNFDVYLAISKSEVKGKLQKPNAPATAQVETGVPVRLAKTGQLLACQKEGCLRSEKVQIAKEFNILQLGQLYTVPLTGGSFRSQSAKIEMDSDGLPKLIQVKEEVAAAESVSATAENVATQLAALPAELREAELARTTALTNQAKADAAYAATGYANETAAIQAQLARANAENDLQAALGRSGNLAETSSLLTQAALWEAKAKLSTAQINAGLPVQTAGLAAQTMFLNAQDTLMVAQAKQAISEETSVLGAHTALINAQTARVNAIAARQRAEAEVAQQ